MIILGIETSCDETAAAVVENGPSRNSGLKILSSVVASSEEIHKKYGGIVPEEAAREQVKCIIPVIQEALSMVNGQWSMVNAIAVTIGPGLIGSLLIGIETAKTLSLVWQKPIIPVNHLTAHIYANFLNNNLTMKQFNNEAIFPSLYLIVSGGHTELVLMKNHGQFKWVGGTRDDAAGECFDKCARLLELGYPGGPEIEKLAKNVNGQWSMFNGQIKLPRPMINEDNLDFSFSGLKTSVLYLLKKLSNQPFGLSSGRKQLTINNQQLISYELQEAITDVLVKKTLKAAEKYQVKSILIGGGVAANSRLREKFKSSIIHYPLSINFFVPDKKLCTDNAAAIAATAFFNYHPIPWSKIKPNPSMEIL